MPSSTRSTPSSAALDRAGAADPCQPSSAPVLDPLGTAADGADRLQPAVRVVRRAGRRRPGLGPRGLHREPRPAADDRHVAQGDGRDPRAPEVKPPLSDEHFSVDGTLVKAWASMKSFQSKDSPSPPHDDDPGVAPSPPADRGLRRHRPAPADRDPADARYAPPVPQRRGELPGRAALERLPLKRHWSE